MKTPAEDRPVILRCLIGSQAHGLADNDSDSDYREVFYIPTREILSLNGGSLKTAWSGGHRATDDEAGWEVGRFIDFCLHGKPNAVELLFAPMLTVIEQSFSGDGDRLRALAPLMVPRVPYATGVLGYAFNCKQKMIKGERVNKWASTYLRILYAAVEYCRTGTLPVDVTQYEWGDLLKEARAGELSLGYVLDAGLLMEEQLTLYRDGSRKGKLIEEPDLDAINGWLQAFRYTHWED